MTDEELKPLRHCKSCQCPAHEPKCWGRCEECHPEKKGPYEVDHLREQNRKLVEANKELCEVIRVAAKRADGDLFQRVSVAGLLRAAIEKE